MTALRNLARNPVRSFLTIVGAAGGICLFVSVNAITDNIRQEAADATEMYADRFTVYRKGSISPIRSAISRERQEQLQGLVGPGNMIPVVLGYIRSDTGHQLLTIGTSQSGLDLFPLVDGERLGASDDGVLVGTAASRRLSLDPGGAIPVESESLAVRGVFSIGSRFVDSGLLMSLENAQDRLGRSDYINLAVIRVDSAGDVSRVMARVNQEMPSLRAVSGSELVGNIRILRAAETFAAAFSIIALVLCCAFIANTLLMAVLERTEDIGILMAIGWSSRRIWALLAAEALVLSMAATVAGNVFAVALLGALSQDKEFGLGMLPVTAPATTVVTSFGLALALGLLSSVYPSIVATRLSPLDVIRRG